MHICRICKVALSEENSYQYNLQHGDWICRKCSIERANQWNQSHKERHSMNTKTYRQKHIGEVKKRLHNYNQRIKYAVISHYSPSLNCVNCSVDNIHVLTVHHINNDGARDRILRGLGSAFYRSLIKEGFPKGYEILCMNCNYLKKHVKRRKIAYVVIKHYSNNSMVCAQCGCSNLSVLTIDHIHGMGRKHVHSLGFGGGGDRFYYWLKRNNYPEGYQVLCFNCQFIKRAFNREVRQHDR